MILEELRGVVNNPNLQHEDIRAWRCTSGKPFMPKKGEVLIELHKSECWILLKKEADKRGEVSCQ